MQISNSFFLATFARLIISILFFWVGILLLAQDPNLEPTRLFAYIIDKYIYIGFKGFVAAGVMAMVMSTADSYINAATITLSYDIRKAFGIDYWSEKRSLIFTYICAVFIGTLAFVIAFYMKGLLQLFLLVSSFYLPVVTVPFLLAIFGFRTSSTSVLAGIASGLIVVLLWRIYVMDITGIDSVIPGMITNIIFLFGTHYLLAQSGGWIGIKDYSDLYKLRQTRKDKVLMLIKTIKNFNFFVFCQKNTPKQESTYTFFGIFCIVFVFSTMYSMPSDLRTQYSSLIKVIYHSVLIMSSIFLTYPIWPITFRNKNFISIFWMLGLFYTLVFVGGLQIIISNFGQFQLMIFLLGAVVLSILVHWQTALFLMVTGMFFSIQFLSGMLEFLTYQVI